MAWRVFTVHLTGPSLPRSTSCSFIWHCDVSILLLVRLPSYFVFFYMEGIERFDASLLLTAVVGSSLS
jgi:hypothetical protein